MELSKIERAAEKGDFEQFEMYAPKSGSRFVSGTNASKWQTSRQQVGKQSGNIFPTNLPQIPKTRNACVMLKTGLCVLVIFTLGRPSTLTPEDGDTRVGLSQS